MADTIEDWEKIKASMLKELKKELALMPPEDLDLFVGAVMEECQKRAPKVIDVENLKADTSTVRELVEAYRKAFESVVNDSKREKKEDEVGFVDAFMSTINFVRLIAEDIERRQEMPLEYRRTFRQMLVATLNRSLMSRVMN